MDAAEFSILALQIVQVIGFLFFKPWAQGYSQEKSKNYARREDTELLLAELRAFTSAQKGIETKFADDLWSRQTLRNEKRAVYSDVLVRVHEATRACQNVIHWRTFMSEGKHWEGPTVFDMDATLRKELSDYHAAQTELIRMASLASIFASAESARLLIEYLKRDRRIDFDTPVEIIDQKKVQLIALDGQLVSSAKSDLGIAPADSATP